MKKMRAQQTPRGKAQDQRVFSAAALRAFVALPPHKQQVVLNVIAVFSRVPPSRLLATEEQREAARPKNHWVASLTKKKGGAR